MGKLSKPVIFDATAGLGRESLILQSAGARVYMFERNPVIWLLLVSAMKKAQVSPDILSKLKMVFQLYAILAVLKIILLMGFS